MDKKTTIAELKEVVKSFCVERDWDQFHNPKDLAIGVVTEAAELIEHFRFKGEEEINELLADAKKREEIADELADILFFILRFAGKNNIDLSSELNRKMKKNKQKYPVEKARGSNKKYNEIV